MSSELFDSELRAARRDRAFRSGTAMFLYDRAFAEILDRLGDIKRNFSSALLIGTPDPSWPDRLSKVAGSVTALDPGLAFAKAAQGSQVREDAIDVEPGSFDLIVATGTLDTVNDLPGALLRLRFALMPDSLLIGAMSGGDTLPLLRRAMRAADRATGEASPHVHPRIEPSALAHLLTAAGFVMPVVDVERIAVSYRNFRQLVADIRAMGMGNLLSARSRRPLTRVALAAAEGEFGSKAGEQRSTETFELLHFAAWSPPHSE